MTSSLRYLRRINCALANNYFIFVDDERCEIHGGCSQGCVVVEGEQRLYFCTCGEGYELTSDNKTCRALGKKCNFS